jgi:hypothetical protein
MFLYLLVFVIILIVLLSAVLINLILLLNRAVHKRFEKDMHHSRHLDDILFR